MDCKKNSNLKACACTYEPCPRKGACCDCVAYHRNSGELPGCFFTPAAERTYDRSVENFIRTQKKDRP
ncbi:MAG: DUF6485 family protein [Elusimicrobiales bacterium]|nr:DUF6485 family protein [Elusimicrobiales bacterium]